MRLPNLAPNEDDTPVLGASFVARDEIRSHTGCVSDTAGPTLTLQAAVATKSTETLSQFLARILDQLSLSAWLPSAAIVFISGWAFALRTVLDEFSAVPSTQPQDWYASLVEAPTRLGSAMARLAESGWGGALLALAAVIVLTLVTQAFSFESIRVLEGYWGTSRPAEWLADKRCARHARVRERFARAHRAAIGEAWAVAEVSLAADTKLTPAMLEVIRAAVLKRETDVRLPPAIRAKALRTDWEAQCSRAYLRRRDNLAKRLRDYPEPGRENPTLLGNIMRYHEDQTGDADVESFVPRVFDTLPLSMQVNHDDQRTRLDLYCSMVFILPSSGLMSGLALLPHYGYAVGALVASVLGAFVCYRAAMASARAYGLVLLQIAQQVRAG